MEGLELTTACLLLLVFIIIYYAFSFRKKLPPGPKGWPIIGNLLEFGEHKGKLPELLEKYAAEYGNVFLLRFGGIPIVVVNGYETINEVLVKRSDVFSDRPEFLWYISKIGSGVILSNHQKWKDMRRMSLHALRDFGMGRLSAEEKVRVEVNVILNILSENENKPIQINPYLAMATSNIICSIIFGSRFEYNNAKFQKMIKLLNAVFSRPGMFQICNAFPLLRLIPKFNKGMQENIDAYERFSEFVNEIVEDHEHSYDENNIRDFIDMFIKFRDDKADSSYTLRNFLRNIIDLFMAGTETSSTTLNWAFLFMVAHPDVQAKCQAEIDTVVGSGRMVTYADRTSLPYVEATVLEVQRLSNIGVVTLHCLKS